MAGQASALGAGALGQREVGGDALRLLADGTGAGRGVSKMAGLAAVLGGSVVQERQGRAIAENLESNPKLTAVRLDLRRFGISSAKTAAGET